MKHLLIILGILLILTGCGGVSKEFSTETMQIIETLDADIQNHKSPDSTDVKVKMYMDKWDKLKKSDEEKKAIESVQKMHLISLSYAIQDKEDVMKAKRQEYVTESDVVKKIIK